MISKILLRARQFDFQKMGTLIEDKIYKDMPQERLKLSLSKASAALIGVIEHMVMDSDEALEALDKKEYKKALEIFKQLAKDVIEGC